MILAKQLGMIPSWQFDQNWAQNPNFNNHVIYPPGMTQMTVQPTGPNYSPIEESVVGPSGTAGFGRTNRTIWRARQPGEANCCENCACGSACPGCPDPGIVARINSITTTEYGSTPSTVKTFRGLNSPLDFFESPAWANRKWIVIGGAALLGLAALGGITAILR